MARIINEQRPSTKKKPNIKNNSLLNRIIKEGESIPKKIIEKMINSGDPQDVERFKAISNIRNIKKNEREEQSQI